MNIQELQKQIIDKQLDNLYVFISYSNCDFNEAKIIHEMFNYEGIDSLAQLDIKGVLDGNQLFFKNY